MYEYIKGTLVEKTLDYVIIESHGIGYKIFCPQVMQQGYELNQEIKLFVTPIYREDSQRLFGFIDKHSRHLFNKLSEVSGIGPKLAIGLLAFLKVDEVIFAIQSSNAKLLSTAPGIGKKTAERIIVELKDKMQSLSEIMPQQPIMAGAVPSKMQDGISALMNLGYSFVQAKKAIDSSLQEDPMIDLSQLITKALKTI